MTLVSIGFSMGCNSKKRGIGGRDRYGVKWVLFTYLVKESG